MKYLFLIVLLFVVGDVLCQPPAIYRGGDGNGYSEISISETNEDYYLGGNGNGYSSKEDIVANMSLFLGGPDQGYDSKQSIESNDDYFKGGNDDGYSSIFLRTPFIWTGDVGTSWTVTGNWNYNLIPGIFRPVIIPDGVPNWPFVNAGLFAIGDNPNGSNYRCASLWIQENAFLQTRLNNRIENYGLITIDGEMRVKKITADAFKNFEEGTVLINSGGELVIKP